MDAPEVYWIHVAPRKQHMGETVALVITLVLWFVLLYFLVGHPLPPQHAGMVAPAHASETR
ncbi:MAG: hypothetical protein ACM36C_16070 [Acidobacteriota bacterium]